MSSKFVFFIPVFLVLLLPSIAYSGNSCSRLFSNQPTNEVLKVFEAVIFNDILMQKIDEVRKKYDGTTPAEKYGATVTMMSLLRDLEHLPYEKATSESQRLILLTGVSNLNQDLVHISPTQLSTRRLITENLAVTYAHLVREAGKAIPMERSENVVSLNKTKIDSNSDYLAARKNIFDLINSYVHQTHVSPTIMSERIEELLLGDVRYSSMVETDRAMLVNRIVREILNPDFQGVESTLEKYFYNKEKERI